MMESLIMQQSDSNKFGNDKSYDHKILKLDNNMSYGLINKMDIL